eukprot:TRINITY_DN1151_c0_g1_i1.p2 TRINITY_DN1151_c0_g1~~TRINITY_DN1151_c0_g1_i1.p2  ORF type:complete len:330 (+),score=124.69 TRINITY_DN1151_c0_g1_i1:1669-2658(+)
MAHVVDEVRRTTALVVALQQQQQRVRINDAAVVAFAPVVLPAALPRTTGWRDYPQHFTAGDQVPLEQEKQELLVRYVLALDTINFCFWQDATLEYDTVAGGLKQVAEREPSWLSPERLATVTEDTLKQWYGRVLPLADERARLLRETGTVLQRDFGGSALRLLERAGGSAAVLVDLVAAYFAGFRDQTVYRGHQVFLYKRAQIFAADVWGAFEGEQPACFSDIDKLTMFADYRVPQLLRHVGILEYDAELEQKIAAKEIITSGTETEIELRAATVQAVERLCAEQRRLRDAGAAPFALCAVQLDVQLWCRGEAMLAALPPHHRTLTVFY